MAEKDAQLMCPVQPNDKGIIQIPEPTARLFQGQCPCLKVLHIIVCCDREQK
jgi:hypothetical protein